MKEIINSIKTLPNDMSMGFLLFGTLLIVFHKSFGINIRKYSIKSIPEKVYQSFYLAVGILLISFGLLIIII